MGGEKFMDQTLAKVVTIFVTIGIIAIFGIFSLRDNPHREEWAVPNPLDHLVFPSTLGGLVYYLVQFIERGWPGIIWDGITSHPEIPGITSTLILFISYIPWEKRRRARAQKYFGHV